MNAIASNSTLLRLPSSLLLALLAAAPMAQAQTFLPSDASASCTVPAATFNSWFSSGKPAANGAVVPANSITFQSSTANAPTPPNTINCNFYQWSQQMFLWLTSPVGKQRVFSAPGFYTLDANNNLVPNKLGIISGFSTRSGKSINATIKQAGGNPVLMAQGNQIVYYSVHVNNVYALFAKQNPTPSATLAFPTTQAQLNSILTAAGKKSVPGQNALAMELKASWIEAQKGDEANFVTMTAEIPTFTQNSSTLWTQSGKKKALLKMIGLHVVGSVANHPEMIWATYEYKGNAANATYSYINSSNATVTVNQPASQNMLLAANNAAAPFNVEFMKFVAGDATAKPPVPATITAVSPNTIAPSNTLRLFPWGANGNVVPNPLVTSAAQSNTEVISINNNVLSMLPGNDVRKNYLFMGATWTDGGFAPTSSNQVGTSSLANTTMETYDTVAKGTNNCFGCHNTANGLATGNQPATTAVSHIFGSMNTSKVK